MHGKQYVDSWYQSDYAKTFNSGVMGLIYSGVYAFMEFPHRKKSPARILEVGAGSGVYRRAAKPRFSEYTELDLREWPDDSADSPNVTRLVGNAEKLSFARDDAYDRVIATCLLVHLDNPLAALKEWKRVVKPGGSLTLYVPPEAGWLVRLARRVGPWRTARRLGYDPARLAHLEHKYSYQHLEALVREVFDSSGIKIRSFPLPWFRFDLSLFNIFEIAVPQTVPLGHQHGDGPGASRS